MKYMLNTIDWFIPPAFLLNTSMRLIARFVIGTMVDLILIGIGLYVLDQNGIFTIPFPVMRGVLVLIGGLALLKITSPFILDDRVADRMDLPFYQESDTIELVKPAFLQRLAMMIVLMLIPMIIYASIFLTNFQLIQLIADEFVLLAIIILIGRDQVNAALVIIICAFYSLAALSPTMFIPLNGSQFGIIAIFLGVSYSCNDRKINVLNIIMAISGMITYKYLEYFYPSPAVSNPFWVDLLLTVTLLIVIVLTIRYYLSDRLKYRQRIHKNEQFLTQILDLHPNLIFVKDPEGRLAYVNSSFYQTFHPQDQVIIGKRAEELLINSEEIERFKNDDLAVLQEGVVKHIPEERITRKDGEEIWVETIKSPIRDTQGNIVGVLGLSTNITEKKQAEEALQETRDRYRMIIEHAPIGITADHLGWISSSNPAFREILGYSEEELASMHCSEFVHPDDLEKTKEIIEGIISGTNKISSAELKMIRKDEDIRSVLLQIQGRFDQDGSYLESIASVVDITEKKAAELLIQQQLTDLDEKNRELKKYIESNLQLENFAYLASHDLKAPIRTIVSFGQLLKKSAFQKLDNREQEFLKFIISASSNLHRLTLDLLSYSRVRTQRRQFERVNLQEELDHLIKSLDSSIHEANAQIFMEDIPKQIIADKTFIRQIFQNLISNSIKFAKNEVPPLVSIYAIEREEAWEFEIRDNGIGIKSQYYDKIFLLFQKLHPNEQYDGSGIGLAICRKIVELHQGKIWVESVPKSGTSIFFTISKSLEPTAQHSQSQAVD